RLTPMLGHGVLIRTAALQATSGFPCYVSEDLAFTIRAAELGLTGMIAPGVVAAEDFPPDYRKYWQRLCRWSFADADIRRRMLRRLLCSRITATARIDLALRELRLPLAALYWPMLLCISIASFFGVDSPAMTAAIWWGFPGLLLPLLPSLRACRRQG